MIDCRDLKLYNEIIYRGSFSNYNGKTLLEPKLLQYLLDVDDEWYLLEPVVLTKEWLLDNGIDKYFREGTFEVRENYDLTFTIYAWSKGVSVFIKHIKYVHEFQNIKQELTIHS